MNEMNTSPHGPFNCLDFQRIAQKLNASYDFRKILREDGARQCGGALQFSGRLKVSTACQGVGRKKEGVRTFRPLRAKKITQSSRFAFHYKISMGRAGKPPSCDSKTIRTEICDVPRLPTKIFPDCFVISFVDTSLIPAEAFCSATNLRSTL